VRPPQLDSLKDILTPDAAELLDASRGAANRDSSRECCQDDAEASGCCRGDTAGCCDEGDDETAGPSLGCCSAQPAEGSECGCSARSASSQVVQRRDGKGVVQAGVSKEEYRALKKAGQTPRQLAAQRGSDRGSVRSSLSGGAPGQAPNGQRGEMLVLFATQGGASMSLARDVAEDAWEKGFSAALVDLSADDAAQLLVRRLERAPVPMLVFVTSTWTGFRRAPAHERLDSQGFGAFP